MFAQKCGAVRPAIAIARLSAQTLTLAQHHTQMSYEIKNTGKFKYVEEGEGETLILLHGLFGALSNFSDLIEHFRNTHKVVIPLLPLFELSLLGNDR